MRLNKYDDKKSEKTIKIEQNMKKTREQEWLKENKDAIDKHNERIKTYGCFSDEHRRF